jgi:hypothetical protein
MTLLANAHHGVVQPLQPFDIYCDRLLKPLTDTCTRQEFPLDAGEYVIVRTDKQRILLGVA